jgi:hypothetical protein
MGVPFGVRFFLLLAEKHFFLALIRKICRPVIFSCFTEGGVFGAGQNKEREARAVWEFPVSQCRPLSAVPLLRGRRGRIYTDFLLPYLTNAL